MTLRPKDISKVCFSRWTILVRHLELIIICSTVKSRVILNKRRMKEGLKRSPERSPVTRSIISFYFCSVLLFFPPFYGKWGGCIFSLSVQEKEMLLHTTVVLFWKNDMERCDNWPIRTSVWMPKHHDFLFSIILFADIFLFYCF